MLKIISKDYDKEIRCNVWHSLEEFFDDNSSEYPTVSFDDEVIAVILFGATIYSSFTKYNDNKDDKVFIKDIYEWLNN